MLDWLEKDINQRSELGISPRHRHKMMSKNMICWEDHMNTLADSVFIPRLSPVLSNMFLYTISLVLVQGLPSARNVVISVENDSFTVSPRSLKVDLVYWMIKILKYFKIVKWNKNSYFLKKTHCFEGRCKIFNFFKRFFYFLKKKHCFEGRFKIFKSFF